MTDTLELELQIKRVAVTKKSLAKQLGITEMALSNKIKNISEFKASEIVTLASVLHMTSEQRDAIFFGQKCE